MLGYIVVLVVIGCVTGQRHEGLNNHNQCHGNTFYTEMQVITKLAELLDIDGNGFYREAEIVVGLARLLGKTLSVDEAIVLSLDYEQLIALAHTTGFTMDKQNFVREWHLYFHDQMSFAESVFDAFDDNKNAQWEVFEIDNILKHILYTHDSGTGDGIINHTEFVAFFTEDIYKC